MKTNLATNLPDEEPAPHQRMAQAIIDMIHQNGECLPQDLLAHGFSREETVDRWHNAYAAAYAQLQQTKKSA